MAQPLRNPEPDARSYVERVRELVEQERVPAARKLLAEAEERGVMDDALRRWQRLLAPAKVLRVGGELGVDRTPDFQWLKDHAAEHRDRWVALFAGELLAEAETLKQLLVLIKEHPSGQQALVHRIY